MKYRQLNVSSPNFAIIAGVALALTNSKKINEWNYNSEENVEVAGPKSAISNALTIEAVSGSLP